MHFIVHARKESLDKTGYDFSASCSRCGKITIRKVYISDFLNQGHALEAFLDQEFARCDADLMTLSCI